MKCVEFLEEYVRCRRGMPVARIFRQYFCEGNHERCPLKMTRGSEKRRAAGRSAKLLEIRGKA